MTDPTPEQYAGYNDMFERAEKAEAKLSKTRRLLVDKIVELTNEVFVLKAEGDPEQVWDAAVDEAYYRGWLHQDAVEDVKGRNPHRSTKAGGEAVTAVLSGAGQRPLCNADGCGEDRYLNGMCEAHYREVYRNE